MLAGAALGLSATSAMATTTSNDEVRAVVAEMLSDAETRSSLLAGGDAGHDGRFYIAGDGFRLNIGGMLQFRYVANFREDDAVTAGNPDDFTHGFQTRRSKIDFNGELNKDWFFRLRLSNDLGDSAAVDYAYAGYKFANGLKVTWGQFKLPLLREELISDAKQLAAERSLTNGVYSQGYSQGVEFAWEAEQIRFFAAFSDGLNSRNTDFNSRENTGGFTTSGQADYAFTGRVEFLGSGNWKQFEDFTAAKGGDFGWLIGAAAHWQQSDNTGLALDTDRQTFEYTVDASVEGDSWNLYGAFIGRHQENRFAGSDTDTDDFGAVVQAGWRFAENTEVFARWDAIFLDDDRLAPGTDDEDTYNFLTVGFNQYYAGHAAKATIDAVYAFERTDGLFTTGALPNTGVGLLGSSDDGEIVLRLQFQVVF
jgi:hypothetical protein